MEADCHHHQPLMTPITYKGFCDPANICADMIIILNMDAFCSFCVSHVFTKTKPAMHKWRKIWYMAQEKQVQRPTCHIKLDTWTKSTASVWVAWLIKSFMAYHCIELNGVTCEAHRTANWHKYYIPTGCAINDVTPVNMTEMGLKWPNAFLSFSHTWPGFGLPLCLEGAIW